MSRRWISVLLSACAVMLLAAVLLVQFIGTGGGARHVRPSADGPVASSAAPAPPRQPRARTAEEAGRAFLAEYVRSDGRVVRKDQGGDTVSEGQAYAMLVAASIGDRKTFDAAWTWTRNTLQRRDGLLSWRWADGQVTDPASASDADLDAARALVIAGKRFGEREYTSSGVALGRAVLDGETAQTGVGRILTAGSWANAEPYPYNPSYTSPGAMQVLANASGDPRWGELDAGSRAVTAALLTKAPLPPDWAQVHADGAIDAMPGPQGHGESVRYGYDAARTSIRFAESCRPADRALAARQLAPLDRSEDHAVLDLGGAPLSEEKSVVAATARAAAVAAGGNPQRAVAALNDADQLAQGNQNYYGAAWAALGRLMLTDPVLGGCPPLSASS